MNRVIIFELIVLTFNQVIMIKHLNISLSQWFEFEFEFEFDRITLFINDNIILDR